MSRTAIIGHLETTFAWEENATRALQTRHTGIDGVLSFPFQEQGLGVLYKAQYMDIPRVSGSIALSHYFVVVNRHLADARLDERITYHILGVLTDEFVQPVTLVRSGFHRARFCSVQPVDINVERRYIIEE